MKVRVRFTKVGRVRWTSHRDVARMWERALRRGRMPVAYTAGFTPRPQLSFGLALPTGCESIAEYLDIALDEPRRAGRAGARASGRCCPTASTSWRPGVLEPGTNSLQEDVSSCRGRSRCPVSSPSDLDVAIERVLDADVPPHPA